VALGIGNRAVRAAQIAFAERIGNDQDKMHAAIEAALLQLVGDGPALPAVRKCRTVGCTDDEACPGGCSWSQPEICSTCAAKQDLWDAQRAAMMLAQQHAAERHAVMADEQTEVAKMMREDLAGATWRQAVACAAEGAGSPTEDDGVHERITADAEWYAHLLGTPPVVF